MKPIILAVFFALLAPSQSWGMMRHGIQKLRGQRQPSENDIVRTFMQACKNGETSVVQSLIPFVSPDTQLAALRLADQKKLKDVSKLLLESLNLLHPAHLANSRVGKEDEHPAGPEESETRIDEREGDEQLTKDLALATEAKSALEKYASLRPTEAHKQACLDQSITDEQFYEQYQINRKEVVSILVAHIRLLEAAKNGQLMSVQILAPVCVLDTRHYQEGLSALHAASLNGSLKIATHLVRCGASVNVKDSQGRTPLDLARENGHAEIVKLLLSSRTQNPASEKLAKPMQTAQESKEKEQQNRKTNNSKSGAKKKSWWSWCS